MARWVTLTIANGTATTESMELVRNETIVGILTPVAWTAADLYIQVSKDGTNFYDLNDAAGTTLKAATGIATAAVEFRIVSNVAAVGATQGTRGAPLGTIVRLRSVNTASEADVNQGAARTIQVLVGE